MSIPVKAETVAIIAERIIARDVLAGMLGVEDFKTEYKVPGQSMSYRQITHFKATKEAWELIKMAEASRPDGM